MKKNNINLLTTGMAVVLFIFGLLAMWFGKIDVWAMVAISIVSIALITFKNDGLKKFIYAYLKIKKDE